METFSKIATPRNFERGTLNFELSASVPSLRRVLDSGENVISAATRFCAVYGHPVRHSASPAMQNAGIAALGLNWRYIAFDVHPDNLSSAIRGAAAMKFVGLNLTVPHKLLAVSLVDELDESAREWGAVNTVQFLGQNSAGAWLPLSEVEPESVTVIRSRGFNTDADAIARSIEEDLDFALAGKRVFLLGAGGAGRVAALRLAKAGVGELILHNRTESKASELAGEIAQRFPGIVVSTGYAKRDCDLVLNATSLGLKASDPLPIDVARFPFTHARAVYDMIYRPAETPFLAAAREAGCRVANGLGMLLYQGARALEIWTGKPAPLEVMRDALRMNVYGRAGCPGST